MKTIKQILDRHSQEVQEAIKQRKGQDKNVYFTKGERPSCKNCRNKNSRSCKGLAMCNAKTFRRK